MLNFNSTQSDYQQIISLENTINNDEYDKFTQNEKYDSSESNTDMSEYTDELPSIENALEVIP